MKTESYTPISDAAPIAVRSKSELVSILLGFNSVIACKDKYIAELELKLKSLRARIDQLNMELSLDLRGDARKVEIEVLRARNDKLAYEVDNERILRYAAEAERDAETVNTRSRTIKECAALFSGGPRNREMYINDIEESILSLLITTTTPRPNAARRLREDYPLSPVVGKAIAGPLFWIGVLCVMVLLTSGVMG